MPLEQGSNPRHGRLRLPWRSFILGLLAILGYYIAGPAPELWVFSRAAISQGELWTLISGHWMHSDLEHAVWNISALIVLGSLFEQQLKTRLFTDLLLACVLMSFWLIYFMPDLSAYCGLSGILNTLLVTGIAALWQHYRAPSILLILALALIKNLMELFTQEAIFTHTTWPSVPEAHIVGMAIGLAIVMIRSRYQRNKLSGLIAARPG